MLNTDPSQSHHIKKKSNIGYVPELCELYFNSLNLLELQVEVIGKELDLYIHI